ncbi:hypothetical protein N7504_010346 [Penicillium tannophilum]|nr:hypothetical protein N7504_010346 [Penicillium tannophilum]
MIWDLATRCGRLFYDIAWSLDGSRLELSSLGDALRIGDPAMESGI